MADIRVKDLTEATVPGPDYYLLTDSATDGVKKVQTKNVVKPADIGAASLTGVETLTNKTIDASNNTVSNLTTTMFATNVVDNDGTLAANSSTRIPTQAAVKAYADKVVAATDAMVFKGIIDCSANPNYPAADRGWTYKVSVAGKIGGASGVSVEVGDTAMCLADGTASGDQATVGANWNIVQANLVGAVTGPASSTSGNIATFNGTGGTVIQDGGKPLPSGAIVGTSDTQTLTGKTIDTASNTFNLNGVAFGTATEATAALNVMVGDTGLGGTKGLVPAPAAGDAAAGKFLKADGTFAVPAGGTGSVSVADRTALKALSTSGADTVILLEVGREGAFTIRSGSVPLSDPNEGVYVASNTAGFYWERLAHNRTFNVRWFGAVLDNSTDDTSAIQAAINFASLFTSTTAGPRAAVYCPPGFSVKTTAQLSFTIPIKIDFQSVIFYNNTTGRAMFFNEAQPTNASYFSYWDVFLQGIYAVPATAAFPASINTSGPIGISIRGMIFSKFECREGIGFSNTFLELDGRGLTYASNNQTILHNTFTLGQIANNGLGISLKSLNAATSSVEGNRFFIQQINQNCFNIVDGDATYQASTSNTYDINAMDNATTIGIDTYCPYNKWYIGFAGAPGTTLRTNAGCDYSRFEFGNNETTDIVLNYNGGGNHNQILTQTPSALPATQTAVSGTAYQNTFGVPIIVSVAVSGGGQVDMRVDSPDGAEILVGNAVANGFITFPVLPHGWKWKLFTTSGTVTYGTAHIFATL